ncbi:hypothetical protein [Bosea sp. (in: a-proteobacteria)]|uniref:hypothetical protein n=1 Tax=Bosea sp. (in: a-proteobacteria) TaxID=1871050 RepID=UPI001ACB440F|nr:hypothetical protein [Bosea sp. (in: a-proteobacteria)]MBN9438992.1 hypothetical protein [Bosea sp. (in: a-proteobacteria)]
MNARTYFESGTKRFDEFARLGMPELLRRAIAGEKITYGELQSIVGGSALSQRLTAMKVGELCEMLASELTLKIPPLNAIIVNRQTGLPSHGVDGFLANWLGLSPREIDALTESARSGLKQQSIEDVFNFAHWPRVAAELGIALPASRGRRARASGGDLPDPAGFACGPESEAHKELKLWAAANPQFFSDYGDFPKGQPERLLSSGDRVDVLFENGTKLLVVEVKTKEARVEERARGVFQCIKYRATAKAMQLTNKLVPAANAVLLLDHPAPASVRTLAELHNVDILSR